MPGKVFDVLNEIVVDRGSNPYLSKIECYEHDRLITKVSTQMSVFFLFFFFTYPRYKTAKSDKQVRILRNIVRV